MGYLIGKRLTSQSYISPHIGLQTAWTLHTTACDWWLHSLDFLFGYDSSLACQTDPAWFFLGGRKVFFSAWPRDPRLCLWSCEEDSSLFQDQTKVLASLSCLLFMLSWVRPALKQSLICIFLIVPFSFGRRIFLPGNDTLLLCLRFCQGINPCFRARQRSCQSKLVGCIGQEAFGSASDPLWSTPALKVYTVSWQVECHHYAWVCGLHEYVCKATEI